jgi:hypothetical protein
MHVFKGGQDADGYRPGNAGLTLTANLTPEEEQATRERLAEYLAGMDADKKALPRESHRGAFFHPESVRRSANARRSVSKAESTFSSVW